MRRYRTLLPLVLPLVLLLALSAPLRAEDPPTPKPDPLRTAFEEATVDQATPDEELRPEMRHPDDLVWANLFFSTGRFDEAIAQYKITLKKDSRNRYAAYLLGCLQLETGQAEAAVKTFAGSAEEGRTPVTAQLLAQLSQERAEKKPGRLLKQAVERLKAVRQAERQKGGTGAAQSDPILAQIHAEMMFGVGPFSFEGISLRQAMAGQPLTARDVAALTLLTAPDKKKAVATLKKLTAGPKPDLDLLNALYLLTAELTHEATAITTLEALRKLEPDNGYYDAMLSVQIYKRRALSAAAPAAQPVAEGQPVNPVRLTQAEMEERIKQITASRKREHTLLEAAIGKPRYDSRIPSLVDRYGALIARTGFPFRAFIQMRLTSPLHGKTVQTIAKSRLRGIGKAIQAGKTKEAAALLQQTRVLSLKLLRDHPTTPGAQLAATVFAEALATFPEPEPGPEEAGVDENWDFETDVSRFALAVRKIIEAEQEDRSLITELTLLPVPTLQAEAIAELARQEQAIAKRIETLLTDWPVPLSARPAETDER